MRLGACALVLAITTALAPTSAQAQAPDHANEVVAASIAQVTQYVGYARDRLHRRADRQAVRASLQRDRAALRDVRAELRSGEIQGRLAVRIARQTASCASDKLGLGFFASSRVREQVQDISAAAQAAEDAYDPDGEDADRIEDLIAEARQQRDFLAADADAVIDALAPVRCHWTDPDLDKAKDVANAAEYSYAQARSAIQDASDLIDQQFPG